MDFNYNNPVRVKKGGVFTATLRIKDDLNKVVDPVDTPVWTSSNTSVATVSAASGGKTATVTADSTNVGFVVISVTTNTGALGLNPKRIHGLGIQVVDSTKEPVAQTAGAIAYIEPGVVS